MKSLKTIHAWVLYCTLSCILNSPPVPLLPAQDENWASFQFTNTEYNTCRFSNQVHNVVAKELWFQPVVAPPGKSNDHGDSDMPRKSCKVLPLRIFLHPHKKWGSVIQNILRPLSVANISVQYSTENISQSSHTREGNRRDKFRKETSQN